MPDEWEYNTARVSGDASEHLRVMQEMAEQGWEAFGGNHADDGPVIYLRRRRRVSE